MGRLSKDDRVTINALSARGTTRSEMARPLAVSEGTVRYRLTRMESCAVDGRSRQEPQAQALRSPGASNRLRCSRARELNLRPSPVAAPAQAATCTHFFSSRALTNLSHLAMPARFSGMYVQRS